MGFFLTDMINSAFAKPGTNAANDQSDRNAQLAQYALQLLGGLGSDSTGVLKTFQNALSGLNNQVNYANSLQPGYQSAVTSNLGALRALGSAGYGLGASQQAGNQAFSAGVRNANMLSPTVGTGLKTAMLMDARNQANLAQGKAFNQYNSPDALLQRRQAAMNGMMDIYNNVAKSPSMSVANGLSNIVGQIGSLVYGQPTVQVGTGLADYIGSALGQIGSTYLNKK